MAIPVVINVSGIFVSGNSFTGKYTIPDSPGAAIILQSIIDEWERKTIVKLLGVELGKLLIAYKEAQPNSDPPVVRYDDLIALFDLQPEHFGFFCYKEIYSSLGIEDFLTAVIYFHYVSETQIKNSQSGVTVVDVETAKVLSPREAQRFAESKWNKALETSDAIQWFCRWKKDETTGDCIYPEYAGIKFQPQYSSVL